MKGLGRTFQIPKEFGSLTVLENLLVASPRATGESLYSVYFHPRAIRREERQIRERAEEVLEFLNLAHVAGKLAAGLSGGQKKLLELGRALLLSPSCILLDEPFAGVNPVLIEQLSERILQLNKERNIAFMIIEHHLEALRTLSNDLYIMDQGRVIAHGDPSAVLDNPAVQEAYMGGIV
ncbi:ATP-binding cassette domain-containing protein [Paracandidimonas soli]